MSGLQGSVPPSICRRPYLPSPARNTHTLFHLGTFLVPFSNHLPYRAHFIPNINLSLLPEIVRMHPCNVVFISPVLRSQFALFLQSFAAILSKEEFPLSLPSFSFEPVEIDALCPTFSPTLAFGDPLAASSIAINPLTWACFPFQHFRPPETYPLLHRAFHRTFHSFRMNSWGRDCSVRFLSYFLSAPNSHRNGSLRITFVNSASLDFYDICVWSRKRLVVTPFRQIAAQRQFWRPRATG